VYNDGCAKDITGGYIFHFVGQSKPWVIQGDEADLWSFFTPGERGLSKKQKEFIELKDQWTHFKDYEVFNFCAAHLDSPPGAAEAFSCYNPGKKIAIVSLYTPEISSYAVQSEKNIRAYCEEAGYTFYVYRDSLDPSSHGNWSKAKALLNHHDDHEVLIWMDSDTLIFNPSKRFEDILERCAPVKKVIACEDIGANNTSLPKGSMFNSGVVIFRCHPSTKNLLQEWWDFRLDHDTSSLYASGGDQEVLINLLKQKDGFGFNRKVFPMNTFNTEPRFVDEDTFIIHFMAYPRSLKDVFMKYWNDFSS
jgi:lipopolysaccharide biosynthesis glycosyltransferase